MLHFWFVEYTDGTCIWRRYYADREEARAALRQYRETGTLPGSGQMGQA